MDGTCTIQDNIHLSKLNIYVSRILGTYQNRFCRVTPAKFIRYLKSFYKAYLDINKPLRLCFIIYTLLKFRSFGAAPTKLFSSNKQSTLYVIFHTFSISPFFCILICYIRIYNLELIESCFFNNIYHLFFQKSTRHSSAVHLLGIFPL